MEGVFGVGDETIEDQFGRIAVDVLDHLQRLLVLLQTPEVVQELLPATRLDSEAAKRWKQWVGGKGGVRGEMKR